jgi:D-psicose/D-tagatose/L-ribulose 3-epimerase
MRPEPLETSLERAKRLGYSSIEIAGEPDLYTVEDALPLLKKYGIDCWGAVTIMEGKRNLIAPDAKQRSDTIAYMKQVITLTSNLGGKIICVVPSTVGGIVPLSEPEEEWNWAVEGLREVASFAQEKGIRVALEPLNRLETYFLNRADQAVTLAKEVGHDCGIAFDVFHMAIEERNIYAAMRESGPYIVDVHVADNNRSACGDGSFDWPKIMSTLKETGYGGGVAVEFMPPVDRTPVGKFGSAQLETDLTDVTPGQLQFIRDHGSGLLSNAYYTELMRMSAETLLPFLK